jgi:hypothetical protein
MKKILVITSLLFLLCAGYITYTMVGSGTLADTASAMHETLQHYNGTIYVAGMGGHFAQAVIEVDPASPNPIIVKELDRVEIGTQKTHPTHDPRIDLNDSTKMYWSTYKIDKEIKGKRIAHVGVSDLTTGDVIKDVKVELPERAKWINALYCASAQTKDSYLPISMANEAYIDVFNKKTFKLEHRVYLDNLGYKNNYFFFHGVNSPDMKVLALTINKTQNWVKPDTPAPRLGQIDMLLLDLPELEKGKVKVISKNTITGSPEKTLTFRQTFTPDGKYLLQSGGDRFYLLKGDDMGLLDEEMMTKGENHDAVATPDSKYAILSLRSQISSAKYPEGKQQTDGMLQLYDINAKSTIGEPVSVCYACHKDLGGELEGGNAVLCGLDINWKKM